MAEKRKSKSSLNYLYTANEAEIGKNNLFSLNKASLIVAIIGVLDFVFSLTLDSWRQMKTVIVVMFFAAAATYILSATALKRHQNYVLPVTYTMFIVMIYCAAYEAIENYEFGGTTTSLTIVFFMIPILVIDKNYRINSFICISAALVVAYSFLRVGNSTYDYTHAMDFALNTFIITIISMFFGYKFRGLQLARIDANRQLTYQRNYDVLTGLPNRRQMYDKIDEIGKKLDVDSTVGAMMIDIDRFKNYNDIYGHQTGDDCLKKIAQSFIKFAKENNIDIYRYGGEEFFVIANGCKYEQTETLALKLSLDVYNLKIEQTDSNVGYVTVSIGFAEASSCNANTIDELISLADSSLYKAKENGRNEVVGYLSI